MTDPARILPAPTVLIDHAEQLPWAPFVLIQGVSWLLPTERAHLNYVGDYAIKGLDRFARIERKARDLYSTLYGSGPLTELGEANPNQDRLRRELMRFRDPQWLEPGAHMGIWIEGSLNDLLTRGGVHDGAFQKKEPWEAYNLIESIGSDYGIPVQFVGGPRAAALRLGTLFRRIHEQATSKAAQRKAERRGIACLLPWIPACVLCGAIEVKHDDAVCSLGFTPAKEGEAA